MTQDITSLIEKLEGAEVGSVELDALIYSHLNCTLIPRRADYRPRRRWPNGSVTHQRKVTTSLDAALALAERVLPGWRFAFSTMTPPWAQAYPPGSVEDCLDATAASTLPLALCLSVLQARAQSEAR